MTISKTKSKSYKIPAKIVICGAYLVLSNEPAISITPSTYLNLKGTFTSSPNFSINIKNPLKSEEYIKLIIERFFKTTKIFRSGEIELEFAFDEGFFTPEGIKTGLGTSSCLIGGIVKILSYFYDYENDVLETAKLINKQFNPLSSNIDVVSNLKGNILYKQGSFEQLLMCNLKVIIGSLNKSTDTRKMLGLQFDFSKLNPINKKIVESFKSRNLGKELKNLFKEYLMELRNVSEKIVPIYQFNVLKSTFDLEILGCGVSGSGGEDAVWCLVRKEDMEGVIEFWSRKFNYVGAFDLPMKGGLVEIN